VKLLFDQNLSDRLCRRVSDVFPGSQQVKQLGLERASDNEIWQFARVRSFAIVTMDSDFADIAALRGAPPKIVWLRCGNKPAAIVERLLRDRIELLAMFERNSDAACLELY
jgi:predicted nuclease of predicted toxin-antitoxin system